jgi:hypothetical protein
MPLPRDILWLRWEGGLSTVQQDQENAAQLPELFPDWDSFPETFAVVMGQAYSDNEAALKDGKSISPGIASRDSLSLSRHFRPKARKALKR